jgi:hypothetical protein
METILKLSGLTEVEFKKLYLGAKNTLIALGYTEQEAIQEVCEVIKKTIYKVHGVEQGL